jgi:hypothetical protein
MGRVCATVTSSLNSQCTLGLTTSINRPLLSVLAAAAASIAAVPSSAAPPQVTYDVAPAVACRDVTTDDFAAANPDERLIEAAIQVSSLIRSGSEGDLLEYFYRFDSSRPSIRIVDYSPQTTLASDVAGNVSIEQKEEQTKGIGVTLAGPRDLPVNVAGSGDLGAKSTDAVRYELVAPMTAVAASGTLDRGRGVYFKLRPSRSASLEGAKEFVVVLRVPADWRGDFLYLSCTATGVKRGVVPPLRDDVVCGRREFIVALYAEGDTAAKAAAERMVRAEWVLLRTISANRQAIQRRFYPTLAHKLGVLLAVVEPDLPEDWARHVIFGAPEDQIERITEKLPSDVQQAVSQYAVARRQFRSLSQVQ